MRGPMKKAWRALGGGIFPSLTYMADNSSFVRWGPSEQGRAGQLICSNHPFPYKLIHRGSPLLIPSSRVASSA